MRYVLLTVLIVVMGVCTLAVRGWWAGGAATAPTTQSSPGRVDVEEFAGLIGRKGHILLDVRTAEEHAAGHIASPSELVNFEAPNFAEKIAALPKEKTYLIYCRSGRRSHLAATQMQSMGFAHLVDLKGGFIAWERAGKAVER